MHIPVMNFGIFLETADKKTAYSEGHLYCQKSIDMEYSMNNVLIFEAVVNLVGDDFTIKSDTNVP